MVKANGTQATPKEPFVKPHVNYFELLGIKSDAGRLDWDPCLYLSQALNRPGELRRGSTGAWNAHSARGSGRFERILRMGGAESVSARCLRGVGVRLRR